MNQLYAKCNAGKVSVASLMIFVLLFAGSSSASAQRIGVYFPHFAGQEWDLLVPKGQEIDTVLTGRIPEGDTLFIDLPAAYAGYRGMARWMLRGGGGIDMVLNGEDFRVVCLAEHPTEEHIRFQGSKENRFLLAQYQKRQLLVERYAVMQAAMRLYEPNHQLFSALEKEVGELQASYSALSDSLQQTPLYAARFLEILNFTRGQGAVLGMQEEDLAEEAALFLQEEMDWMDLYRSNHWSGVIHSWLQLHLQVIQDEERLYMAACRLLNRIEDREIFSSFSVLVSGYLIKFGKDELLDRLAGEILKQGKLINPENYRAQFCQLSIGDNVPVLKGQDGQVVASVPGSGTMRLLVFYQSTCGPCERMLQQLEANYPFIDRAGIEVISISADLDKALFEHTAATFPWELQLFDGQGFEGENFTNYGVMGTPTLMLIDDAGQLLRRTSKLAPLLLWLDTQGSK